MTIAERAETLADEILRSVNDKARTTGGIIAPEDSDAVRNLIVASFVRGGTEQLEKDLESFEKFIDKHFCLNNVQWRSWRSFKEKVNQDNGII